MSEKKKLLVLQMDGGIGKHIAATALLPKLKQNYEKIVVVSTYPDIFNNNPYVYRSLTDMTPFAYEDYYKVALAEGDVFYIDNYRDYRFRKKNIHMIEGFCNSCGIPYDSSMKPELYFSETDNETINDLVNKVGDFIIVQFHGGKSPYNVGNPNAQPSNNMVKDYDVHLAENFVALFKEEYPKVQVLNFGLPDEIKIKGTVEATLPYKIWFGLLQKAETFVVIDSSLQHASACTNKKGIVMWGATSPKMFGYDHNLNIVNECDKDDMHCTRPYFVPSSDFIANNVLWSCNSKKCMKFDPIQLMTRLQEENLLKSPSSYKKVPSIDLSTVTSQVTALYPALPQQNAQQAPCDVPCKK